MTHAQQIQSITLKKEAAEQKYQKLLDSIPELVALDKKIDSHLDKLNKLIDSCPHENHIAEYESNTGNYDLYESYWVNVKCHDCGQRMTFFIAISILVSIGGIGQRNDRPFSLPQLRSHDLRRRIGMAMRRM